MSHEIRIERSLYQTAVGLSYLPNGDNAPVIELLEDQAMADEVVRLARRFGVPVIEKPELVNALSVLPIDSQIPPALYEVVAVVLHQLGEG